MFAEKEKNGVSAPHPPPGGMLTHDGNYGARSGGGTKSIIGGLQNVLRTTICSAIRPWPKTP